jgi:hypothetical protein
VVSPKTVLLPQKNYIKDITSESLRNLEFPLDWEGILDYVGLPAIMKPYDGGGWKNVSKVNSLQELWREYDQTDTLCMVLQEFIAFDHFVRCYCVGQEEVLVMPYDPTKPYLSGMQYVNIENYLTPELHERVVRDVKILCRALGYNLNTVEFAIKDGVPYAIDFMNPAPDAEIASVGEYNHNWVVNTLTNYIFKQLETQAETPQYRWDSLLAGGTSELTGEQNSENKEISDIVAKKKMKATTNAKSADIRESKKIDPKKDVAPKQTRAKKASSNE